MVASRKPKPAPRRPRRKRETLEDKYRRVMAEPLGTPIRLTRREALYVLRRLEDDLQFDPSTPDGNEQVKRFYGLWPEPERPEDYPD